MIALENIIHDPTNQYGNKAYALSRLISFGYNVPDGFALSIDLYIYFLKKNKLDKFLKEKINGLNIHDTEKIFFCFNEIKEAFINSSFELNVEKQFFSLKDYFPSDAFAVRSSGNCEDMPNASFAGQYDTFLNISASDVSFYVKSCYASIYNPGALVYRRTLNFPDHVEMGIIIQKMIQPDLAGVLFTIAPNKQDCLIIEYTDGLGDKVVSGLINPNRYYIDRKSLEIVDCEKIDSVNILELKKLARLSLEIEGKFGSPQDVEFAIKDKNIYMLQTRNITKYNQKK